jgi:hypothetical protein
MLGSVSKSFTALAAQVSCLCTTQPGAYVPGGRGLLLEGRANRTCQEYLETPAPKLWHGPGFGDGNSPADEYQLEADGYLSAGPGVPAFRDLVYLLF